MNEGLFLTSFPLLDEVFIISVFIDILNSDLQLSNVTVNEVDKCHRIGPIDNDGKQHIIIKFTKHSPATKVFRERRKLSKLISKNLCAEAEEINFIFSDINGNLKIRLKEPIGNQQIYSFRNKIDLAETLAKLELDGYQLVDHDFEEF